MSQVTNFFCALGIVVAIFVSPASAQQLAFELPDAQGQNVSVRRGEYAATVVCFLGVECPMARVYAGRLSQMQETYDKQDVRFIAIDSNRQDSLADLREFQENHELTFPLLQDVDNRIADRYGASRTPEVYLLDRDLKLRYHGRIDDQYGPGTTKPAPTREDLKIALDQLLAGRVITIRETPALGCVIGKVKQAKPEELAANDVTYCQQVVRVLQRNCIECHRHGEIGPFAMDRYEEVVGWADTMLETIEDGRMPPWHADPEVGHFANERRMSEADKQVLRDWIDGGLKRGDSANLPEPEEFVSGWQLPREPDAVFDMRKRPFIVPRDGVVEYQYYVVDPGFEEDQWISAAQVVPGNREVVHHAIVFVRPPDGSRFSGFGWLAAYVPGQRTMALPAGFARRVPAGSKLVFQMHYTPNGSVEEDTTKVGLCFVEEPDVTHEVFTLIALNQQFEIPPQSDEYQVTAKVPWMPSEGVLLAATPHMHYRGKSFELSGQLGGKDRSLLRVPAYDFNWQHTYVFKEPLALERLASLRFEAAFDNSPDNPFNPDPSRWVTWGDQTWEEMAVAFFDVARPRFTNSKSGSEQTASQSSGFDEKETSQLAAESERRRKIQNYVDTALKKLDVNGDGKVSRSETSIIVRRWNFSYWDNDQDNVITREELRKVAESLF